MQPPRRPVTVGLIANPMSGRDVRRLASRASTTTPEIKRDQVGRAAIGAVAGGAQRLLVVREPFRIAVSAVENLEVGAEIRVLEVGAELRAVDSERAVAAMDALGCDALIVLGGDGTQRVVARAAPHLPIVPLSTGTNNAFPVSVEATSAGVAAGLVASGAVARDAVVRRAKCVRVRIEGEPPDLALIDAVLLRDDAVGNFMPFDPARMRHLLLARAEPAAVGSSPVGGLLLPCGADDDFGVEVLCGPHEGGGRRLLAPIAPGLFRTVHVEGVRRVALGEEVAVEGPGVLAFDGDRERALAPGQKATLQVTRGGPLVIDVPAALREAARAGCFVGRTAWRDAFDRALTGMNCC